MEWDPSVLDRLKNNNAFSERIYFTNRKDNFWCRILLYFLFLNVVILPRNIVSPQSGDYGPPRQFYIDMAMFFGKSKTTVTEYTRNVL